MKSRLTLPLALLIATAHPTVAREEAPPADTAENAEATSSEDSETSEESPDDAAGEQDERALLAKENRLASERLTHETNELRAEITRLKMERELITERLALESARRNEAVRDAVAEMETERDLLARQGEIAKQRADKLENQLKAMRAESALEITALQNEIRRIETLEQRARFADAEPVYLKNPLREDGTLVISDRRIPLNGPVTSALADFVTTRIQFWNNMDRELPIFIVIDSSPGGSVMAGYRILKAMEASEAPVHVVVRSFAASMAAAICTLAEHSYAYPNAVLLHHQISNTIIGARLNLTEQREFYQRTTRWWDRFGVPLAEKMGITADEFIELMYKNASSGDWTEFADEAKKLKWVNHVVEAIEETAILQDPDTTDENDNTARFQLEEKIDADGKPFVWLPRLDPTDVWFIYNPDGYYRTR